MKILVLGSKYDWSIENFYLSHWANQKIEVKQLAIQNIFYKYYYKSITNKILFRLGLSNILKTINKTIVDYVNAENPDIVFVFKGQELLPSTIEYIKVKGIKIVNYNPDSPFVFSSKGSGNSNITKCIPLYDAHFCYNKQIVQQIETKYKIPSFELPFGFEADPNFVIQNIDKEKNKVCFIGNPDSERAAFIKALANQKIEIDVYGNNWDKFIKHKNVTINRPVYGKGLVQILQTYRVQINIMRKHNLDSHNMRSFEIPGAAGIQLAPFTPDHNLYFENGKNIFLHNNVDEAVLAIKKLLALTPQQAMQIKTDAHKFSKQQGYSYAQRAQFVIETIKHNIL